MEGSGPTHEKLHTFGGNLPEDFKAKALNEDTHTTVEYGEITWTTEQTVRDVLQNHLDAQTENFYEELLATVLDTEILSEMAEKEMDAYYVESPTEKVIDLIELDNFMYMLFLYKRSQRDLTPEGKQEVFSALLASAIKLPIRQELLNKQGYLDQYLLEKAVLPINERLPKISYKIISEVSPNDKAEWVKLEDLESSEYDDIPYSIEAIKIEDKGSGFDAKLSAFYKSLKTNKRYLRGKFGEGAKMSQTSLIRNGAKIRSQSSYLVEGEDGRQRRVWRHRPTVDENYNILLEGVQVDIPDTPDKASGSYTEINVANAEPKFKKDFLAAVDPRSPTGLGTNCLSYSNSDYRYPVAFINPYSQRPLGVSLSVPPEKQYVQDLKVGKEGHKFGYSQPAFSYNFLDNTVLTGRDRNRLSDDCVKQIQSFWQDVESAPLLNELIHRLILDTDPKKQHDTYVETSSIYSIINQRHSDTNTTLGRTREIFLKILPDLLKLEAGKKYLLVKASHSETEENQNLIRTMQARGYEMRIVRHEFSEYEMGSLNEAYGGKYRLDNTRTIKANADALIGQIPETDRRVRRITELYTGAYQEVTKLLSDTGLSDWPELLPPIFLETVDLEKDQPIKAEFDAEKKTWQLKIRPEIVDRDLRSGSGADYWQKRIAVELLATYHAQEQFIDRNASLFNAQKNANELLDRTIGPGQPDVDALPERFDHAVMGSDEQGTMEKFVDRMRNIDSAMRSWQILEDAKRYNCTLDTLEDVIYQLNNGSVLEPYNKELREFIKEKVVVENGIIGYVLEAGENFRLQTDQLDDLLPIAEHDGRPIYRLGKKIIMPIEIPINSVIRWTDRPKSLVMFEDKILHFEADRLEEYRPDGFAVTIGNGCLFSYDWGGPDEERAKMFIDNLKEVKITSPERAKSKEMKFTEGVVATPLPLEYGVHEWNNPVRVFEDILQNHLDASGGKKVEINYEVRRGEQRIWVSATELDWQDEIVGLNIRDFGDGYAPNDIGNMGNSSRKSPLFAGKYGEGQKMIAAAAARQGLELTYSSHSTYQGQDRVWQATVGTQEEDLVVKGKITKTKRVIFNVNSIEDGETPPAYSSSTTIRLPEGTTAQNFQNWQEWSEVFDPRQVDRAGRGGLARYAIDLREEKNPNVIEMGYMRILLDEPGAVYENGLKICDQPSELSFGYDVPSITSTRERNDFDRDKFDLYFCHMLESCPDPRFAEAIIKKLKEKYLKLMTSENRFGAHVAELDLNLGNSKAYKIYSKPFWDIAYANNLGGYAVISKEKLQDDINYYSTQTSLGPEAQRALDRARRSLANLNHIPAERQLHVPSVRLQNWSRFLPNAQDMIMNLAMQEVPANEPTLAALRLVVTNSAGTIGRLIDDWKADPKTETTLIKILLGKIKPKEATVEEAYQQLTARLNFWRNIDISPEGNGAVYLAPESAGYLGIASGTRLGVNEKLLAAPDNGRALPKVGRHELTHKIFEKGDYYPDFIILLMEQAKRNIEGRNNTVNIATPEY